MTKRHVHWPQEVVASFLLQVTFRDQEVWSQEIVASLANLGHS